MGDLHIAWASLQERKELLEEADRQLLVGLQDLSASLETLPDGIPKDRLQPLAEAAEGIRTTADSKLQSLRSGVEGIVDKLEQVDEVGPALKIAFLEEVARRLEYRALVARILGAAALITRDIDRRIEEAS